MNFFTALGLLVFWGWCFQLGMSIGLLIDLAPTFLRIFAVSRGIDAMVASFTRSFA